MSGELHDALVEWQTAMINLGVSRSPDHESHNPNGRPSLGSLCRYCHSQVVETGHRCDWCGAPMLPGG
jgi:hypothetical protein